MTAKELHKMRKLEIENRELREKVDKCMTIYRKQLYEIVALRTQLELIEMAMAGGEEENGAAIQTL